MNSNMNGKRFSPLKGINKRLSLSAISLALVLAGCTSGPSHVSDTAKSHQDPQQLIELAQNQAPAERDATLISAAQALSASGDYLWAKSILEGIYPSSLSDADFIRYSDTYSATALTLGEYLLAQQILNAARLEQLLPSTDSEQEVILRQRRAKLYSHLDENRAAIDEHLNLEALLLEGEALATNREQLWQVLSQLSRRDLADLKSLSQGSNLLGWLELAELAKNNQAGLAKQLASVEAWQAENPTHPASQNLPADLQLLESLVEHQPHQVTLMLPMSGKLASVGRAVRDGFMAAYYQTFNGDNSGAIKIEVIDSQSGDIRELYQQAVNNGSELVIGPLNRGKIAMLNQIELPVPLLSLNHMVAGASGGQVSDNLFQFGLAIEDEAKTVAQRMWLEGHRQVMVIVPETTLGERSLDAFSAEWLGLGGEISTEQRYRGKNGKGNYATVIKSGLQIDNSKQRVREIRNIFGAIEYEPRRRQDIDAIYITAQPRDARQIKPTLAFHYAGDLPVYATSQSYSGKSNRKLDSDLNGLRLTVPPWLLDADNPTKTAIESSQQVSTSYQMLYALGVDAHQIYPRLAQFKQVQGTRIYGATGRLTLGNLQTLNREPSWAIIRSGRLQALGSATGGY